MQFILYGITIFILLKLLPNIVNKDLYPTLHYIISFVVILIPTLIIFRLSNKDKEK